MFRLAVTVPKVSLGTRKSHLLRIAMEINPIQSAHIKQNILFPVRTNVFFSYFIEFIVVVSKKWMWPLHNAKTSVLSCFTYCLRWKKFFWFVWFLIDNWSWAKIDQTKLAKNRSWNDKQFFRCFSRWTHTVSFSKKPSTKIISFCTTKILWGMFLVNIVTEKIMTITGFRAAFGSSLIADSDSGDFWIKQSNRF